MVDGHISKVDVMDNLHNILMIAYYFPPMGGAGVQRTLKFVKYLPEFGWQPFVLTAHPPKTGLRDAALLKEITQQTPITRTAALLPPQWLPWRLRNFIIRWLLVIDEQIGWMPFAVSAGRKLISRNNIRAIYSTSSPYTDHIVAYQLHKQTGLPWIADFRDPWIGNISLRFATPLHRSIITNVERQVVQSADRIIVVSPPMGESFCERIPGIASSKVFCLPNGYDQLDFENARLHSQATGVFTLVYTGSFYHRGRTADPILHAIHSLVSAGRIPRGKMRVLLVGDVGKSTHKWVSSLHLEDVVEMTGYVPHEQSIGYLMSADALLLVIGAFPGSSSIYTGKIFEYLAARKPILCLSGEGVSADLVRKARAGVVVPPDDASQVTEAVAAMYTAWENGRLSIDPDMDLVVSFERRKLTSQLASILSSVRK